MKYYPHTRLCMGSESWDPADIAKAKKIVPTGGLILLPRNSQSQLCLKVPKLWKRVMIYVFEFFFFVNNNSSFKSNSPLKEIKDIVLVWYGRDYWGSKIFFFNWKVIFWVCQNSESDLKFFKKELKKLFSKK